MIKIGKRKFTELYVLFSTALILVLNSFIFADLQFNQQSKTENVIQSLVFFTVLYLIALGIGVGFALLGKRSYARYIILGMLVFMVFHIGYNLYDLIIDPRIFDNGIAILSDAMLIWVVNILVFSLWFWILDRGGEINRELETETTRYDLLFPQYQSKIPGWEEWKPKYLDYLFFSFFTSTGFSPADTLPLTKRAKLLMMIEATFSLVIIGMVVSRAISLI